MHETFLPVVSRKMIAKINWSKMFCLPKAEKTRLNSTDYLALTLGIGQILKESGFEDLHVKRSLTSAIEGKKKFNFRMKNFVCPLQWTLNFRIQCHI